jgi:hypothetical protein
MVHVFTRLSSSQSVCSYNSHVHVSDDFCTVRGRRLQQSIMARHPMGAFVAHTRMRLAHDHHHIIDIGRENVCNNSSFYYLMSGHISCMYVCMYVYSEHNTLYVRILSHITVWTFYRASVRLRLRACVSLSMAAARNTLVLPSSSQASGARWQHAEVRQTLRADPLT